MTLEECAALNHTTPEEIRKLCDVGFLNRKLPHIVTDGMYEIPDDAMVALKAELNVSVIKLRPPKRFDTRGQLLRRVLKQRKFTADGVTDQADIETEE